MLDSVHRLVRQLAARLDLAGAEALDRDDGDGDGQEEQDSTDSPADREMDRSRSPPD